MTERIPGPWSIPSDQYHAERTCESSSTLECLRKSVQLYHGTYVTGAIRRPPPGPQQNLGIAVHALVLEPLRFPELVCLEPKVDRRTRDGKAHYAQFLEKATGKTILSSEDWERCRRMAQAIYDSRLARQLLEAPGPTEQAVRWETNDTGIRLKCRFDKLIDCGPIVDLKTAADPTPREWAMKVPGYGYHRQASLYQDGRACALGGYTEFLHIVVGSTEPHDVVVYKMDSDYLLWGHEEMDGILSLLDQCRKTECWDSVWQDEIQPLTPRWRRE